MKIVVDRTKCTGLGLCEALADEFFEVDEAGQLRVLNDDVDDSHLAEVKAAIDGCPTAALRLDS
jgi:ferredoxin